MTINPLIIIVIMMRSCFLICFTAAAILVATLPEEDFFFSPDMSDDDSSTQFSFSNDDDTDDDLFDPTDFSIEPMDFAIDPTDVYSSSMEQESSCLSQDEQEDLSLETSLRLRHEICGTSNDESFADDPSEGREGTTTQKTTVMKTYMGLYCLPDFPVHLCCEEEGKPIPSTSFVGYIFETMNKCQYGMSISAFFSLLIVFLCSSFFLFLFK